MLDWFTIVAQLLNFLVLIWLLKRFLYQPILAALDARERRINTELAEADDKKRQAQAEQETFLRKNQEFAQQRTELFNQVSEEAKVQRQRLLEEARQEAAELRCKQQEALANEQKSLIASISRRTQTEVLAITRQALQDLAGVSLENHIVAVFIEKLQLLDEAEKQQVLLAVKNSATSLAIRTAFELSPTQRIEISQAIAKIFAISAELQFTISPHLMSGIELSSDGYKFSWSVADYLATLEKNLNALLQTSV